MNCSQALDVMPEAVEDRLDQALRAGYEAHLAECAPCRVYFEQLRLTRGLLSRLPRQGNTSPRRSELVEEFRKEFREGTG